MKKIQLISAIKFIVISAGTFLALIPSAFSQSNSDAAELEALKADIRALRVLPNQSHTMIDVEYHFANLWFAGKSENWPLAAFYQNETRSHLNWTIRLQQTRRLSSGEQLDLLPILQGIESTGLAQLRKTIDEKDPVAFESAYRGMMDQCYGCHVASEKPYLKLHIPAMPASMLVDMAGGE